VVAEKEKLYFNEYMSCLEEDFEMATKLTQKEADMLISMLKESVEKHIEFPNGKGRVEFDAVDSEEKKEKFVINISRKGINSEAVSYQGRHPRTGEILLRLDINPSTFHRNPSSGEKVVGFLYRRVWH